jgi:hypothetical protein
MESPAVNMKKCRDVLECTLQRTLQRYSSRVPNKHLQGFDFVRADVELKVKDVLFADFGESAVIR